MIAVVSHAWLRAGRDTDGTSHADAYFQVAAEFLAFHRQSPGFRGRRMMRGIADPLHVINVRWWDAVADYEAMVARPGYGDWICRLSAHVEPRDPMKEYVEVVLDEIDD
jgi:hypothetical protein